MIYFLRSEKSGCIKIGYTADVAEVRLSDLQTGNHEHLRLLGTLPGTMDDEKDWQRRFAAFRAEGGEEWFLPVPELLAVIPAFGLPSCGKMEVVERSVQIRILTVGRKQFSKALLDQLPEESLIEWDCLFDWLSDEFKTTALKEVTLKQFIVNFDLASQVENCDIWGWVVSGKDPDDPFRWVLYVRNGTLHKHRDYLRIPKVYSHRGESEQEHLQRSAFCSQLYEKREQIGDWGKQLFIGV